MTQLSLFYRGTNSYTLEGSNDASSWDLLHSSSFADPRIGACNVPTVTVTLSSRTYRYIRFTAVSYYGLGPGLQYIGTAA